MKKLWGARFSKELNARAKAFSYSLAVDHRLLSADIKVSMAHASMLGKVGLISEKESKRLIQGLWQVLREFKRKPICNLIDEIEDIHTLIQNTLEKKIGALAKKLHTGRSRNDLVATSTRVYLKEKIVVIFEKINRLQFALVECAEKNESVLIPGYTHLQRAQVVSFAHHLLAYVEMLSRDKNRIRQLRENLDECPLGSGALSGSTLPLDRLYVAKLLGFKHPSRNTMDAVSDRDFVIETLSVAAITMMHLSRFSEDLILWNSSEFGFVALADEYSTGSSLMPHKKNPDMLELIKGKTGGVYGNLVSVLAMMKGLPLTYNRDMQEDKKPLFDSLRTTEVSLEVLAGVVATMKVNTDACSRTLGDGFLYATDLLEYLVLRKVPFRDAHDIVGGLVQYALDSHKNLSELTIETFKKFSTKFDKTIYDLFNPKISVSNKVTAGSTNPKFVKLEIARLKKELAKEFAQFQKEKLRHA